MKNITIIGAGGIGSHLMLPLVMTYPDAVITLFDFDKLEEKNLSRQVFSPDDIGKFKADALAERFPQIAFPRTVQFKASSFEEVPDVFISCADNHTARLAVLEAADLNDTYAIVAGNNYFDSEAFSYHPCFNGAASDPRVLHPDIEETAAEEQRRSEGCQGIVAESTPQLATANLGAVSKTLHMLWHIKRCLEAQDVKTLEQSQLSMPAHIFEGEYGIEYRTHQQILDYAYSKSQEHQDREFLDEIYGRDPEERASIPNSW